MSQESIAEQNNVELNEENSGPQNADIMQEESATGESPEYPCRQSSHPQRVADRGNDQRDDQKNDQDADRDNDQHDSQNNGQNDATSQKDDQNLKEMTPLQDSDEAVDGEDPGISIDLFELPLNGTSGYASVSLQILDENGDAIDQLDAGQAFTILRRDGNRFLIECEDRVTGYVQSSLVMVNLPDLIPSIVYNDTNSVSSLFRSSGHDLPEITGHALYDVYFDNARFDEKQFVMPVLYPMAKKIMLAQHLALQQGDSLIIYETFRPLDVQKALDEALAGLALQFPEVDQGINTPPWNQSWFIAAPVSNHQRGCAIDVSIVKVLSTKDCRIGTRPYFIVSDYAEYEMPTSMHELSSLAAAFTAPVSSRDDQAWRQAQIAPGMTPGAMRLQSYCAMAGMSPLASEWWHFNDLSALLETADHPGNGMYRINECVSRKPEPLSYTNISDRQ